MKFNAHKKFSSNILKLSSMMNPFHKTVNLCSLHTRLSRKINYQFLKIHNISIRRAKVLSLSKIVKKSTLSLKVSHPESTQKPITEISSFVLILLNSFNFSQSQKTRPLKRVKKSHPKIIIQSTMMKWPKFSRFINSSIPTKIFSKKSIFFRPKTTPISPHAQIVWISTKNFKIYRTSWHKSKAKLKNTIRLLKSLTQTFLTSR